MSTHTIEVVPVKLEPHPNAEKLSIVKVHGYVVCVRTEDWKDKDRGAYVPPDYMVPLSHPAFSWLVDEKHPADSLYRTKVKKLRGVVSQGFLVPVHPECTIGANLMGQWGIKRYEPADNISTQGDAIPGPKVFIPQYDVESWHRYKHLLRDGEEIVVTEKIHGANWRLWAQSNGNEAPILWVGSRSQWKKENPDSAWWKPLQGCELESFAKYRPDFVFYGELFGQVQDLKYGHSQDNPVSVRLFDMWCLQAARWASQLEIDAAIPQELQVPRLYQGPYSEAKVRELANGKSTFPGADHIREGIVIRTVDPRHDVELGGRILLKLVSDEYLERA